MQQSQAVPSSQLMLLKLARGVSYFAYAIAIIATLYLGFAFFLLLFGANYATPFVKFIYNGAQAFGHPFANMFPTHKVSDTGYLDVTALFAALIYMLLAVAVHALVSYLTAKIEQYQTVAAQAVASRETPASRPDTGSSLDAAEGDGTESHQQQRSATKHKQV